MRKLSVLISGASIAGPALAYWLHRYGAEEQFVRFLGYYYAVAGGWGADLGLLRRGITYRRRRYVPVNHSLPTTTSGDFQNTA